MDIKDYFQLAIDKMAADLHMVGGSFPAVRIGEDLVKLDEIKPLSSGELRVAIFNLIGSDLEEKFKKEKELDFAYEFKNHRFRVNVHRQEGKIAMTARIIPSQVPSPTNLRFSETIYNLTHLRDGMILVVGPSGCGKSSTLAAMIDIINNERKAHIITIEDPVEFLFTEQRSIIEQRELGVDTNSFAKALRSALRQDPNVIMVGEMRDLETVSAAITAAETGHLLMSTLHTSTAPETIQRIVDFFPTDNHSQILNQLASNLRAIIAQELLPAKNGGRIVAREILLNNRAVSNLIRRNEIEQIITTMQTSLSEGMITMNNSIDELVREGLVDVKIAENRKRDLETKNAYY
ncbi:MAG: PilT/PilU family type 4a pilus ATPase [bacterium]|nr:PilT/PilU family type 4a pilus ATPase [bacterium]